MLKNTCSGLAIYSFGKMLSDTLTRGKRTVITIFLLALTAGVTLGFSDVVSASVTQDLNLQSSLVVPTAGKPSLVTKNVFLKSGNSFSPSLAFVGGFDSRGRALSIDDIDIIGDVSPNIPGTYLQRYSFADPFTKEKVVNEVAVSIMQSWSTPYKPIIIARNLVVKDGEYFDPSDSFVGAYNSQGESINLKNIKVQGSISVGHPGVFQQRFSFVDPYTGKTVVQSATITQGNKVDVKPMMFTKDITIRLKQSFAPEAAYIAAYDSKGQAVDIGIIQIDGSVNPARQGNYVLHYSFVDPYTGEKVSQQVVVTVV